LRLNQVIENNNTVTQKTQIRAGDFLEIIIDLLYLQDFIYYIFTLIIIFYIIEIYMYKKNSKSGDFEMVFKRDLRSIFKFY